MSLYYGIFLRISGDAAMKPTLLAVDDESEILGILTIALGAEGYNVITATSAEAFRNANAQEEVDVYLIDVSLPDGNGFTLIKELRRNTDKGIIILTGRSSETDHVVGLEIGADDYITKPFRIRELCARVNAVYRRTLRPRVDLAGDTATRAPAPDDPAGHGHGHGHADYTFDGFRLNMGARALRAPDGAEVELTTAEFDLLAELLKRRGQVLSRDQIMNAVKGRDWESYDRAVDGLVSRLRRKLGRGIEDGRNFIRTVHGVGYSFTR